MSLNNLDFIPRIWNVSGKKVGLAQLCDAKEAAELRDALVKEDHLVLALELCKRCSGEDKPDNDESASWHISADPVREAQVVALQRLSMFEEARNEFSMSEANKSGSNMSAAENALTAFEDALRYPPLYDLAALEQQRSIYTFNRLQRKLYRSTATMASLPIFLQNSGRESDQAVPIVPISKSPGAAFGQMLGKATENGLFSEKTEEGTDGTESDKVSQAALRQAALEDRLCDALQRRRCRDAEVAKRNDSQAGNFYDFFNFLKICFDTSRQCLRLVWRRPLPSFVLAAGFDMFRNGESRESSFVANLCFRRPPWWTQWHSWLHLFTQLRCLVGRPWQTWSLWGQRARPIRTIPLPRSKLWKSHRRAQHWR